MAALVVLRGDRPDVTLGGSLEVIAIGAGYGVAGGLLALGAGRVLRLRPTLARDCLLAMGLLGVAWLTSRVGRSAAAGLSHQRWAAVVLAVICFLGYGLLLHRLLGRRADRGGDGGAAPPADPL